MWRKAVFQIAVSPIKNDIYVYYSFSRNASNGHTEVSDMLLLSLFGGVYLFHLLAFVSHAIIKHLQI